MMKFDIKNLLLLILTVSIIGCSSSRSTSDREGASTIAIIPKPQFLKVERGMYSIPKYNTISYSGSGLVAAELLNTLLLKANLYSKISQNSDQGNFRIVEDFSLKMELGEEGYILEINKEGVIIKAAGEAGLFYGIQSLKQLLPASLEDGSLNSKNILVPKLYIQDSPKYTWRGSMIDIARSYFGIDYLMDHLNRMALYKMNRLHLHLTDDQGWRLELKSKPQLTEIGGKGSVKNGRIWLLIYRRL